jgi:hypothetical protein
VNPVSGVLSEAWALYRAHWQQFATIALLVYVVIGVISVVLLLFGWVGQIVAGVAAIVGAYWLQAAIVRAVEDVRDGRVDLSVRETFASVRDRLGSVIGAAILAGIGIAIGLVLLIVPGLVLLTWWILIIPVIVLERTAALASFGRSRELVRGHGWNVFGVIIITILVLLGVSLVLDVVLTPLPDWLASFISQLVSGTVFGPFVGITWTLLYYRLREANEGAGTAFGAPAV